MTYTAFEYLYRDADNHKSFGCVFFEGSVSTSHWNAARRKFVDEVYFVAEQLGLPPLYSGLLRWSGGAPTDADHCWHEYVGHQNIGQSGLSAGLPFMGSANDFVHRVSAINDWNIWLSPHVEKVWISLRTL